MREGLSATSKSGRQWATSAGTKVQMISGGRSNIFLVSDSRINILIDTGPAFMGRSLLRKLRRMHIGSIDFLVLTHTHFDHAANAYLIKDKCNAAIVVHQSEADYLLSGDSPVPAGTNAFTAWLVRNFGKTTESFVKYHSCNSDITVKEELDLSYSGINARIIHTPGHSSGSVSLVVDSEIALVGDTLFGTYPGSCFPPFADDEQELLKSWRKLLNTGCRIFLPSHGRARTREMLERKLAERLL